MLRWHTGIPSLPFLPGNPGNPKPPCMRNNKYIFSWYKMYRRLKYIACMLAMLCCKWVQLIRVHWRYLLFGSCYCKTSVIRENNRFWYLSIFNEKTILILFCLRWRSSAWNWVVLVYTSTLFLASSNSWEDNSDMLQLENSSPLSATINNWFHRNF